MIVKLTRFCSGPMGTFGRLEAGDRHWFTVERPWLDNTPMKSCVPLGEYDLVWQPTTTNVPEEYAAATWYLDGGTVSSEHVSSRRRTRVAVHIGNTMDDVSGCIAVGTDLATIGNRWGVSRSRGAMIDLLASMPRHGAKLNITAAALG